MENLSGRLVKGYELLERIGAGGFGAVYRAHQTTVGREVAIKIILPAFANHPDFIRRFETEAQIIARLEHLHITPLYDYWRDPEGAYLVMRWFRGGSLRELLQQGPLTLEATALLLDQIASALAAAHRKEVIHRDLKPGNILLDEDGNYYLADFGIAKDLSGMSSGNTQPDAVVGSLDYLSPEQARSEPVTPRTDIYSLGVVLYEALAGQHPFHNLSSVERVYKHINDPLPDIATLDPSVSDAVNEVIHQATAKNPAHRYPDALAVAAAFRTAAALNHNGAAHHGLIEDFTPREMDILTLIVDGLSNKEIAQELFVALPTVKWYNQQIFAKLGVRNRVQAITRARELNLVISDSRPDAARVESVAAADDRPTSVSYLAAPENPYKGLRAFQAADRRDFFGREALTEKLVGRLTLTPDPSPSGRGENTTMSRFLAVVGPSGSGKSSVVKAGLIPALADGKLPGSERWFVVEMLPGNYPLDKLEVALMKVAANQSANIRQQLERDERGLLRVADLILPDDGATNSASELLLVIDQFEEVFTLVEDEAARQQFLKLIYTAVTEARSRVRVMITLRADYYDRPLRYAEFGDLLRSRMETVLPLSAKELERAIAGPAERVGVSFEEGLVASIVSEMIYQAGVLPLLEFALTELFERRSGRVLTHAAYLEIGGAVGALAKQAELAYQELDAAGQETARQMFLRLVTLGEGAEDTRRRAARSELLAIGSNPHPPAPSPSGGRGAKASFAGDDSGRREQAPRPEGEGLGVRAGSDQMDDIIDAYAEYRLLSLDHDPATRTPTVEVAHEAILREWERLRKWLDESREDIRMQRQLAVMAAEWREASEDSSFLLRGSRLEQFESWAADTGLALTPVERQFLQASASERAAQEQLKAAGKAHEEALERRSQTTLRALVGVFALAAILALALSGVALDQRQIAESNAATAIAAQQDALHQADMAQRRANQVQSLGLLSDAQQVMTSDGSLALALAVEANRINPLPPSSLNVLYDVVDASREVRRFEGHTDAVNQVAFSPDSRTALSASRDKTLILWDVTTGQALRTFVGHSDSVTSVAFSPDGTTALSGSCAAKNGSNCIQGELILWNVTTGEQIRRWNAHTNWVQDVAFSPDGQTALSASADGTLILWTVATGEPVRTFDAGHGSANSVAFSPDGRSALAGYGGGSMILWDVSSGQLIHTYQLGTPVYDAAFSPDGRKVVSVGNIRLVIMWDVTTGERLDGFVGATGTVRSVAFSPDGQMVLAAADNGTLTLWDAATKQVTRTLQGQGEALNSVAFSPDGKLALSASSDHNLTLWDLNIQQGALRSFASNGKPVPRLAISPDGRTALGADGTVTCTMPCPSGSFPLVLWDLKTGQQVRQLAGDTAPVMSVAINPDGHEALSGDWNDTMTLWNLDSGEVIRRFEGNNGLPVMSVAFSPNSRTALTAETDPNSIGALGHLILWNLQTGEEIRDSPVQGSVFGAVFSPDGTQAAYAQALSGTINLMDVATGQVIRQMSAGGGIVLDATFSPDGRMILVGSADGTAALLDATTGQVIRRFTGGGNVMNGVAFSLDGRMVASDDGMAPVAGQQETDVFVWDTATGAEIQHFTGHTGAVWGLAFSQDGQTLLSSSFDGTMRLWALSPAAVLNWIQDNRLVRDFTCAEREQYFIEPLCPAAAVTPPAEATPEGAS